MIRRRIFTKYSTILMFFIVIFIFVAQSIASSEWSPIIRLSTEKSDNLIFPDIAVYQNNIHVVWQDDISGDNIYYKKSVDNGNNWDGEISLIANNSSQSPQNCSS